MRMKMPGTFMGIAITLLVAGIVVQITDNLDVFGHNSVMPLVVGFIIIGVGVLFFVLLRLLGRNAQGK